MKKEVCVLAATGMLGTGFAEESFKRALTMKPDVIGCDAGSTDPGPYYLGSGTPMSSRDAVKRDLKLMILAGLNLNIPVLIGSAGTSGGNPHVDWTVNIVKEIAREESKHFKMAVIQAEISKKSLQRYMDANKVKELFPAPKINNDIIKNTVRIVGVMGPEPFIDAVKHGAQVVIAGRSSDTSIFASIPIMNGFDNGPAWHAAKILECGAGSVEQRLYPDCMMAWVRDDSFSVEPPNLKMRCTPVSVVSHALYENSNPNTLVEPGRVLHIDQARYMAESKQRVLVKNSLIEKSERYTIRIEGAQKVGYRYIALGGISDPLILRQLPSFLSTLKNTIQHKILVSLGLEDYEYKFQYRIYGNPESSEPGQIGVVMETLAKTEEQAQSIMGVAWHTALHHPIKEWSGLQSQLAFPYSPIGINTGIVYRFCLNHVIEVDDPLELFPISYQSL